MTRTDDRIELNRAEARMALRDAKGQPHNYVARAALPAQRCTRLRVRHSRAGPIEADPELRASPPAEIMVLDEENGACFLFALI